ncbi:hypothetical protein HID58_049899 [Brassica napus]|uniref:Uncharacterized protein n=1 Tax=Brassica napus TaxID=3708 RepID=A0ABQ8B6A9_BRANA|nr:hypothetical protein HID58_049899 [Brassica napus]
MKYQNQKLFENFENRQVPSNTTPYDQISMLSPQTPRNIRRCVLGKCFMSNHAYHHKSLNLEILYNEFNFDMFPRHPRAEILLHIINKFAYSCFYLKQAVYLLITYTHYNHITNFKPGDLEKTSFSSIKPGIQKKGASTSRRSTRNVLKDITNISHLRKKNEKLPSPE